MIHLQHKLIIASQVPIPKRWTPNWLTHPTDLTFLQSINESKRDQLEQELKTITWDKMEFVRSEARVYFAFMMIILTSVIAWCTASSLLLNTTVVYWKLIAIYMPWISAIVVCLFLTVDDNKRAMLIRCNTESVHPFSNKTIDDLIKFNEQFKSGILQLTGLSTVLLNNITDQTYILLSVTSGLFSVIACVFYYYQTLYSRSHLISILARMWALHIMT